MVPSVNKDVSRDDMSDDLYCICYPVVFGYSLGSKAWDMSTVQVLSTGLDHV